MANIGTVVDGKYEILKLVGKGGMSKVYLAMDKRLNKQWAVKEIDKFGKDTNNEVIIQSAIAEANLIKQLDHPSLPRIVDIIDEEKVIYVIMDYIEGESLNKVLDEFGASPQDLVIDWAKQLTDALAYLHNHKPAIIYRDMKPANVMLKPDGNVKLIDFGIAREFKEQNLADTICLGTKGYAAPEQFGGKGQTDSRTDIYCLGVTLYHLVTGHNPAEPPYEMYPIRYWNPELSGGLERIIQKCTQLNPIDRYQSCAELMYDLIHYEEVDDAFRKRQKTKLNRFITTSALCIIFLLVGVFGLVMKTSTNNADYNNVMEMAEKATNQSEKINYYLNATEIKPQEVNPYYGLIKVFKEDAAYTLEEEETMMKKLNANLTSLKTMTGYGDLAFEIGKTYWYYYDYGNAEGGDNQITRMKSSIQWFEDAINYNVNSDFKNMATIYRDIGKFNEEITLNVFEASDLGQFAPYWENLNELTTLINESSNESEIVKLELFKLVMSAIENHSRSFKRDGITESEMRTLFNTIKQSVISLNVTVEKTEVIKENLVERFDITEKAIENAFRS